MAGNGSISWQPPSKDRPKAIRTPKYQIRNLNGALRISDFGFRISDFGWPSVITLAHFIGSTQRGGGGVPVPPPMPPPPPPLGPFPAPWLALQEQPWRWITVDDWAAC